MGLALIVWIAVEVVIIGYQPQPPHQLIYGSLGVVIIILALLPGVRSYYIAIGLLTGFIALTAIGGGIALLIGVEDARFPLEWLRGTTFKGYTIPALLLAIVVGGSALVACATIFASPNLGPLASMLAGRTTDQI